MNTKNEMEIEKRERRIEWIIDESTEIVKPIGINGEIATHKNDFKNPSHIVA